MADPTSVLTERFAAAIERALGLQADPVVRPSGQAKFGDYQVNGAMALGKKVGQPPREIAQQLLDAVELEGIAAKTEIAGPGFVNVWLDDRFVVECLGGVADPPPVATQTIVIDYSSPNLAKEMHVGHLRSTIIGDALARMFEWLGHTVVRQNHVGEWGTQFGLLIEHLLELGTATAEASLADLNAFYQEANARKESDPEFAERARARVVALQDGDPETLEVWRHLVRESLAHARSTYDRLGVTLTDADLKPESAFNDDLDGVAEELESRGLARVDQGALCSFVDGYEVPLIVRKTDGGYGYQATDLAAVKYRVGQLHADRIVYVVGSPQTQHLDMVFKVAKTAGWVPEGVSLEHAGFGSILGPDGKMYKTRSGETVKLNVLLDEAVERARAVVAEKSPDLAEDERESIARAVGIGAVKYADLSSDRVKDYVFDLDRMLAMEGNTAPYLQYAHARICSIMRRGETELGAHAGAVAITDPAERALAIALEGFGAAVLASADHLQPHRLCGYLFDLAQTFTGFYENCPVLRADDEATRASRLAQCQLTAQVLATGLGLLGIEAPERM